MRKRYKLIKDLPTFKAGEIFEITDYGDLVKYYERNNSLRDGWGVTAYCKETIDRFPNILTDWFEEISEKPKTVDDLKFGDEVWLTVIVSEGDSLKPVITPVKYVWHDSDQQRIFRELGEVFLTKEDCDKAIARDKARTILERDAKGFKATKGSSYYQVAYKWRIDKLVPVYYNGLYLYEGIKFATIEDAKESIRKHEKEWKTYLGVGE